MADGMGYIGAMTKKSIPGGLLIAIEGIDGAGKSTLARALGDVLERDGAEVVLSKEPTNGPWGTQLRASAATGRLSPEQEVELLLRDQPGDTAVQNILLAENVQLGERFGYDLRITPSGLMLIS